MSDIKMAFLLSFILLIVAGGGSAFMVYRAKQKNIAAPVVTPFPVTSLTPPVQLTPTATSSPSLTPTIKK